jgi:hypothetical protein
MAVNYRGILTLEKGWSLLENSSLFPYGFSYGKNCVIAPASDDDVSESYCSNKKVEHLYASSANVKLGWGLLEYSSLFRYDFSYGKNCVIALASDDGISESYFSNKKVIQSMHFL